MVNWHHFGGSMMTTSTATLISAIHNQNSRLLQVLMTIKAKMLIQPVEMWQWTILNMQQKITTQDANLPNLQIKSKWQNMIRLMLL
jgi:hypothetical protein